MDIELTFVVKLKSILLAEPWSIYEFVLGKQLAI
jgi:hypothetical protein